MAQRPYYFFRPRYDEEKGKCLEFLTSYAALNFNDSTYGQLIYMSKLQKVANGQSKVIEITKHDIDEFFHNESDKTLRDNIWKNTKRYIGLFSEAADSIMPEKQLLSDMIDNEDDEEKYLDIVNQHRILSLQRLPNNEENQNDPNLQIPNVLKRKFELYIVNGPEDKVVITPLRGLKADLIGSYVNIRGMVTKVSDVRPCVSVACYFCEICGFEVYHAVTSKIFMPLVECPSNICKQNNTKGKLIQNNRSSKFIPYQEIKIQETPDQIPQGSIPRSFNVIAKGEITRQCTPGDIVLVTGVFLPSQFENLRGGGLQNTKLIHDTYIEAFKITREKKRYTDTTITSDLIEEFEELKNVDVYTRMAKSIAPEIYGLDDVKKALLLLMVGGSTIQMHDGMKIRGDINIALIGDPGVAKSQLLRQISIMVPRGIYTTGKGSSGVGLTAAVLRDPTTKEVSLEGGALVLADMGVCCIDEFDKMDEYDRTAIHEVMEQQSVSIAKAGITTTLNARTSILAAANPIYGRYNKKLTPHQNINLPAALLSRFDLVFLLLDRPDRLADELLSRHIGYVHQNNTYPKLDFEPYKPALIRAYISQAKRFNPKISQELHNFIVQKYIEKRKQNVDAKAGYAYTTPRTLLAIIRLAQAMARLRFSEEVDQNDIDEALRLMDVSQATVLESLEEEKIVRPKTDNISSIFGIISDMCKNTQSGTIKYTDLEKRILAKGHILENLKKCIEQYEY